MGQQQLLLIILVIIIVGIATIIAINTMQSAHESANFEAIQQDILQAHSMSIAYFEKPQTLGGGNKSYTGIRLDDLALPEENENATYEIGDVSAASFEIIGTSVNGTPILTATIDRDGVTWDIIEE